MIKILIMQHKLCNHQDYNIITKRTNRGEREYCPCGIQRFAGWLTNLSPSPIYTCAQLPHNFASLPVILTLCDV